MIEIEREDIESEDKENPNFFILYKESADDILDLANINDDYFLEPWINDYLNGWVKIVSERSIRPKKNDDSCY